MEAAAVGGTLSLLIAQEVALTAACASSMAAARQVQRILKVFIYALHDRNGGRQ